MELFLKILFCIIAGAGAGITTGFAGLSAAAYIVPILVGMLDVPFYDAVAIALASDVLASGASAITYHKKGNIDLKHALPLMISVLVFAIIGSTASYFITNLSVGDSIMGYFSIVSCIGLGIFFIITRNKEQKENGPSGKKGLALTIMFGCYIGFVCGFQGTGGGMMMLFVLTQVMHYEFHKAVGTSVFIMTFTAFIGAVSHYVIDGFETADILPLILCVIFTLVFAKIAAVIANKTKKSTLRLITGILLCVSGIMTLVSKII